MHKIARATVDIEEGGDHARTIAAGVLEHLRRDYPGPTPIVDRRTMERGLQVSEWRGRVSQPDGRLHQRPIYALSRSEGRICSRRLPER